jgi:hypothetical protein
MLLKHRTAVCTVFLQTRLERYIIWRTPKSQGCYLRHISGYDVSRATKETAALAAEVIVTTMPAEVIVAKLIQGRFCSSAIEGHCCNTTIQGHCNNANKYATRTETRRATLTLKRKERLAMNCGMNIGIRRNRCSIFRKCEMFAFQPKRCVLLLESSLQGDRLFLVSS